MRYLAALLGLVVVLAGCGNNQPGTVADALKNASVKKSTLTEVGTLDPKQVREFVLRIDKLMDGMKKPEHHPSDQDMIAWALEILPYFQYEEVRTHVVIPNAIRLAHYTDDGDSHSHILGRAYCQDDQEIPFDPALRPYPYLIEMNGRLGNPHSPWYGDVSYLTTLTHELAHIQGACGAGVASEHTAQLTMLEVMSAMILAGNETMLFPLLDELRGWGLSYLLYDAINGNNGSAVKLRAYREFRDGVFGNPFESARADKSLRHWRQIGIGELAALIHTYSVVPLVKLVEGLGSGEVHLTMPNFDDGSSWRQGFEAYRGHRDFRIDDTVALLRRLEVLAR